MKNHIFFLLCTLHFALCAPLMAQSEVAKDTLALTVTSVIPEPDPNHQEYIFSLWGTAGTTEYKIQIDYHSASMYGSFSDTDFDLAGDGKNHNFIRNKSGDKFWLFKHLDAVVRDSAGATIVQVNGMIQDFGQWRRVLATGVIPAPTPDDTIRVDLGQATMFTVDYFGTPSVRVDAANSDYSLTFGIYNYASLLPGTYYQADLLLPEFVELPDDTIAIENAVLTVTDLPGGYQSMTMELLSRDNILYIVQTHTGEVVATDTISVVCSRGQIQSLQMGMGLDLYLLSAAAADYQVGLAVRSGVIEQSHTSFTTDSVNLFYTKVLRVADQTIIPVQQASGRFERDSTSGFFPTILVHADLLGINGTLYRVTMPVGGSQLPEAVDTMFVDCGQRVGRLDYTNGAGTLGLVLGNEQVDVHVTVMNGLQMKGSFSADEFFYDDPISYVTLYKDSNLFSFDNVNAAEMRMDSIGDTVRIQLNVVTERSHMYCFSANLLPTRALMGDSVIYSINDPQLQDGVIAAYFLGQEENTKIFQVQFQRSDEWNEATGQMAGANSEVWNFVLLQNLVDGIAGQFSYGDETLFEDEMLYHMLREHNTEIWLRAMAGTLNISVLAPLTIPAYVLGVEYHTHVYSMEARLVMENGMLYHVSGANYMVCIDPETEELVELSENVVTALDEVLREQGLRVKKVLRNGMLLLESTDGTYDAAGRRR